MMTTTGTTTTGAAVALWGRDTVTRALAYARPDPVTPELVDEVKVHADELTDREFSTWALALPWARFCTVVRLAAGVTRAELLTRGAVNE